MQKSVNSRVAWTVALLALFALAAPAGAADDTKAREGAAQVQSGARQVGQGAVETAKGIGKTVAGGAETARDRIRDAGRAAEPEAQSAWSRTKEGAVSFGRSVKDFFTSLFD
ncbi:MAG TPA: hypothetical protein VFE48_05395 [Methylomirabilota bacterium]|nr:hypothetical protein [Methylomirabilota bacterium]